MTVDIARATVVSRADTREWHRVRAHDLSASRVAALYGETAWASIYSIWCEMAGVIEPDNTPSTIQMVGTHLEPAIAALMAELHGLKIEEAPAYYRLPDERIGATPDFFINHDPAMPGRKGVLEIKNVSWQAWRDKWPGGDPPVQYWMQAQMQVGVLRELGWTAFDYVAIGALVAGNQPELRRFEFDPEAFQMIRDRCREFVRSVEEGREPEPDEHPATYDALRRRYSSAQSGKVERIDDPAVVRLARMGLRAGLIKARAEERQTMAKAFLLHHIRDAETALLPGYRILAKPTKAGTRPVRITSTET